MTICPYCKYDFQVNTSSVLTRKFCSISCRNSFNQYERQVNKLHWRLLNKIFTDNRHKRETDGMLIE